MKRLSSCPLRAAWLGTLAAIGACASSAPTVKSSMQTVPDASAVVVGKFGAMSKIPRGILFYELQARNLTDGKKWKIPLSAGDVAPDGNSVPFFLELPPGLYVLTEWQLITSSQHFQGDNAGVFFALEPGKTTCIGAVYMGSRGSVPDAPGSATVFKSGAVVSDECDVLAAQLKKKAPLLSPPQRVLGVDIARAQAPSPPK